MINDIFLVRIFQSSTVGSPIILNTFHYIHIAGDGELVAGDVAATVLANLVPGMRNVQGPHLTYTNMSVINLDNPLDYVEEGMALSGNADGTGEALPDFVCWSFILSRARRDIRNGHKRIAGLGEGQINGNNPVAGMVTPLNTLAALLQQDLPASDEVFRPIIYGAPLPIKPPATVSARPEPIYSRIVSASFRGISSQNTRKRFG